MGWTAWTETLTRRSTVQPSDGADGAEYVVFDNGLALAVQAVLLNLKLEGRGFSTAGGADETLTVCPWQRTTLNTTCWSMAHPPIT
jgi:hypothetical protein